MKTKTKHDKMKRCKEYLVERMSDKINGIAKWEYIRLLDMEREIEDKLIVSGIHLFIRERIIRAYKLGFIDGRKTK